MPLLGEMVVQRVWPYRRHHSYDGRYGYRDGVDIDKLFDCVWMAERIIGRELYGHVSKGPVLAKDLR
ncbi:MAG: hypothetical protein CM1200mP15_07530 [Dehalococcoidia bacterium]|nr:MAG: hypothetical protein CM1200mP15_07530 [Dehalococcoidia bacterium]